MNRRKFIATTAAAAIIPFGGCLTNDYEISTRVIGSGKNSDGWYGATIRATVSSNTDWDETLRARIQFEWGQGFTSEKQTVLEVEAGDERSFNVRDESSAEFSGHSAAVKKL